MAKNEQASAKVDFEAAGFDPVAEIKRLDEMKHRLCRTFEGNANSNVAEKKTIACRQASAYADLTAQQIKIMELMAR